MINFKKISAIASATLLAGMSVVAAASYPKPFVDGSTADVAIVYGTGEGVSVLDKVSAGDIQSSLDSSMTTTGAGSTVSGESYKFERQTTKFNIGDSITSDVVTTALDDGELPVLLAEGELVDSENDDFEYEQEITMADLQLQLFNEEDYSEDDPTVGFYIPEEDHVLNYTLSMKEKPTMAHLETADLPVLGTMYYVLDVASDNSAITLLDSAEDTLLAEGESAQLSVGGQTYDVAIEFIGNNQVKLDVNGEITNSLEAAQTYKLDDGSYIGIKDILYTSKDTGISKVEFSIGNGKLLIQNGQEVELNDDAIDELYGFISNSSDDFNSLTLQWNADENLFITETSEITMPGFNSIKLSYGGTTYPAEEEIEVSPSSNGRYVTLNNFPLETSTEDLDLLYDEDEDGVFDGIGKDADSRLVTTSGTDLTFNTTQDDYFIASWVDSTGDAAESYLMKASVNSDDEVTLEYMDDGTWTIFDTEDVEATGNLVNMGELELNITGADDATNIINISAVGSEVVFDELYSKEGLKIQLPWDNATGMGSIDLGTADAWILNMTEEDKDGDLGLGQYIELNLSFNGDVEAEVSDVDISTGSSFEEIGSTGVERAFVYSALATEVLYDTDPDQDTVKIMYHGGEVMADVYITSSDAVVSTGTGSLGEVLVMDSEVSSVSSKNLIIVGGSCINSAAATVLGGAYCGAAFTDATGVGPGQYLIKGVEGAYSAGKLALVVAGYNAEDTTAAATYLTTQSVDTSMEYIGTSATSAEVVTESA